MIFDIDKAASIHIPPAMATTDEFNLTELHLLAPTIHNLAIYSSFNDNPTMEIAPRIVNSYTFY